MARREDKERKKNGILIDYRELGTISIDELAHAIIEDIQAMKEIATRGEKIRHYTW